MPNFGLDSDVVQTQKHIQQSEAKHGNAKWNPEPFMNKMLQVNTDESSDSDDDDENVQLSMTREPLLTWKPKDPKSHPVDYFVPNFGTDQ